MSGPLRSALLPQCPACARRFVGWGMSNARAGRQQIRGKKKTAIPQTMPVKLLKDVTGFGRAGAFVPITGGQFRNDWFPKGIADYIPQQQLRELRLQNVTIERNHSFVAPQDMPPEIPSLIMPMEEEPVKPVEPVAPAVKVQHITPERSVELLQIFLPPRIDFYRQPIESPSVPVEQGTKTRAASEAASILSAAAASKPKANEPISIYGSVSTSDVAASVRAVLAENDEAARVVFSDGDIEFVGQMKSEEKDRVKHLGEFEVEIPIKGAPEAIKRIVRVMPSEAVKVS